MLIKHFVKNLERRPLRLGLFLAVFERLNFPLEAVTICHSVDALQFTDLKQLCVFANLWGFDWEKVSDMQDFGGQHKNAERGKRQAALRLTEDILLRHISELSDGWYFLWHDDFFPDVDYSAYLELYEKIGIDSEVQVVSGVNYEPGEQEYKPKWHHQRTLKHPHFPLHQGISGMECSSVLAVTPVGAKHLIAFGDPYRGLSLEWLLFCYLPSEDRHVWTDLEPKVDNLWDIVGGDIWADGIERVAWNLAWDALRSGDIIPIRRHEIKNLSDCGAHWDLMLSGSERVVV